MQRDGEKGSETGVPMGTEMEPRRLTNSNRVRLHCNAPRYFRLDSTFAMRFKCLSPISAAASQRRSSTWRAV